MSDGTHSHSLPSCDHVTLHLRHDDLDEANIMSVTTWECADCGLRFDISLNQRFAPEVRPFGPESAHVRVDEPAWAGPQPTMGADGESRPPVRTFTDTCTVTCEMGSDMLEINAGKFNETADWHALTHVILLHKGGQLFRTFRKVP